MAVAAVSCHRKRRREGESRVEGRREGSERGCGRGRALCWSDGSGRKKEDDTSTNLMLSLKQDTPLKMSDSATAMAMATV